mgnify:CR=1 FL=1
MSNRLLHIGRVPLIPDPQTAIQASSAFAASQEQTDQVFALGRAFRALPRDIWNMVHNISRSLNEAMRMRDLSSMNDQALADIGLRRDQISMLFANRPRD